MASSDNNNKTTSDSDSDHSPDMRLSQLAGLAATVLAATASSTPPDEFHETLTLRPLPDGKLSVHFEFTTRFSLHGSDGGRIRKLSQTPL